MNKEIKEYIAPVITPINVTLEQNFMSPGYNSTEEFEEGDSGEW